MSERIRGAYRARWNKVRSEAEAIATMMREKNPDVALGDLIAELRDRVENLGQSFHEFNAYYNAYQIAD